MIYIGPVIKCKREITIKKILDYKNCPICSKEKSIDYYRTNFIYCPICSSQLKEIFREEEISKQDSYNIEKDLLNEEMSLKDEDNYDLYFPTKEEKTDYYFIEGYLDYNKYKSNIEKILEGEESILKLKNNFDDQIKTLEKEYGKENIEYFCGMVSFNYFGK